MSSRTKYFVVSASSCLTVLLLIGSVLGQSKSPDDTYKHIGVFSDVVSRIKSEYVEEPDMSSVTLGAMTGMLESIDPYASYLNTSQYKEYLKNFDTYKGGLGMVLAHFAHVRHVAAGRAAPLRVGGKAVLRLGHADRIVAVPLGLQLVDLGGDALGLADAGEVGVAHPVR